MQAPLLSSSRSASAPPAPPAQHTPQLAPAPFQQQQAQEHNLFDRDTLNRLGTAFRDRQRGKLVLERLPDAREVNDFLHTLDDLSAIPPSLPLSERLQFSARDGTVAIQNKVNNGGTTAAPAPFNTFVNLLTVTQDYTRRCNDTFKDGWKQPAVKKKAKNGVPASYYAGDVDALLDDAVANFHPIQRYLLERKDFPAYLHQIRWDALERPGLPSDVVYTVEVAYRHRPGGELDVGAVPITNWPDMKNYTRQRASAAEVTMWAVLNIVKTDKNYDESRLEIIRSAIAALSQYNSGAAIATHIPLNVGNIYQLLRVRHQGSMDGRARYAVVRAVLEDERKIVSTRDLPDPRDAAFRLEVEHKLPKDVNNVPTVLKVVLADLLFGCLGLLYLLRLLDDEKPELDDVIGVAFGIVGAFMLPSLPFWIKLFTGSFLPAGIMRLRRPLTAPELRRLAAATGTAKRTSVGFVASDLAVAHYKGDWLHFTGRTYNGMESFFPTGAVEFSVRDLVLSGYDMAFAMDGREVLVVPHPHAKHLRLRGIDTNGRAVFEDAQIMPMHRDISPEHAQGRQLEQMVLPDVRGRWSGDIDIGRPEDLPHGV